MLRNNRTNLTYLRTTSYLNEERLTVITKIDSGIKITNPIFKDAILDYFDDNMKSIRKKLSIPTLGFVDLSNYSNGDIFIAFNTIGKAKFNPEDKNFDVDLGKKIAMTRAQQKAFKTANKIYTYIIGLVSDLGADLMANRKNCVNTNKKCEEHVGYLIDNAPKMKVQNKNHKHKHK